MALRWYRYLPSSELFAQIRVEFKPNTHDLLGMLALYAHKEADGYDPESISACPRPTQAGFESWMREEYRQYGVDISWTWHEHSDADGVEAARQWALGTALKFWPKFAEDFRKASA
ncbi:hypothetical protein [Nonomuraea typhae]|uniref:hypothetical protein n=1 Tax=Nonomuraea typhae TaxID=2603600 RepID=UPI0012F85119|nr:hypothetical protein [Nonomuraea typhae]